MLTLTRKPGQSIHITAGGVGPHTPIGEVFASGPIEITVSALSKKQAKVGVAAHPGLTILRSELATRPAPTTHTTPPALPPTSRRHLAQKLTVLRILHKLTRQQLAHLSHIPESVILAMESGDPAHQYARTPITLNHLESVAHALSFHTAPQKSG